jgi:hypothetical protein
MMLALATAGQTEFTVSAELSRSSFLPGEPITVVVTVTNATGAKVSLCGSTPQEGFRVRARLKSGDGQTFNCGYGSGGLLVSQDPEERPPRSELAPGQCLKMSSDLDLAHCPLSMFRPGPYEIDVAIEKAPSRHSEPWVDLVPVVKTIEISAPQGEDAAYLRALEEAIASADPKTLKGGTLQSRPLEWGEVLHTRRANAEAICLQRFPTSTYAGYLLRAPAASFGCSSYDCIEKAEETLRADCSGGSWEGAMQRGIKEETIQRCMEDRRQPMWAYAKAARPFLEAHPDFFDAPRIRRELAFCLAFTGRLAEALEQVKVLAQGEGKEAQEARAYLAAREGQGTVREPRRENRKIEAGADGR